MRVGRRVILVLLLVVSACAGASAPISDEGTALATAPPEQTTLPLPADLALVDLEDILPATPQFREFTRENPPNFAEYEEAVFATAACIEALGLEVWGPAPSSDPDLLAKVLVEGISISETYNILVADPKPGMKPLMSVDQALDFCYEWSGLNTITIAQSPSEEQIRAWYEQFRACLKAAGFEGVDDLTDDELHDGAFDQYFECTP